MEADSVGEASAAGTAIRAVPATRVLTPFFTSLKVVLFMVVLPCAIDSP